MNVLWSVLAVIGTVLLFLLKGVGILLLVVLVLGLLLMFCPSAPMCSGRRHLSGKGRCTGHHLPGVPVSRAGKA